MSQYPIYDSAKGQWLYPVPKKPVLVARAAIPPSRMALVHVSAGPLASPAIQYHQWIEYEDHKLARQKDKEDRKRARFEAYCARRKAKETKMLEEQMLTVAQVGAKQRARGDVNRWEPDFQWRDSNLPLPNKLPSIGFYRGPHRHTRPTTYTDAACRIDSVAFMRNKAVSMSAGMAQFWREKG